MLTTVEKKNKTIMTLKLSIKEQEREIASMKEKIKSLLRGSTLDMTPPKRDLSPERTFPTEIGQLDKSTLRSQRSQQSLDATDHPANYHTIHSESRPSGALANP